MVVVEGTVSITVDAVTPSVEVVLKSLVGATLSEDLKTSEDTTVFSDPESFNG